MRSPLVISVKQNLTGQWHDAKIRPKLGLPKRTKKAEWQCIMRLPPTTQPQMASGGDRYCVVGCNSRYTSMTWPENVMLYRQLRVI